MRISTIRLSCIQFGMNCQIPMPCALCVYHCLWYDIVYACRYIYHIWIPSHFLLLYPQYKRDSVSSPFSFYCCCLWRWLCFRFCWWWWCGFLFTTQRPITKSHFDVLTENGLNLFILIWWLGYMKHRVCIYESQN